MPDLAGQPLAQAASQLGPLNLKYHVAAGKPDHVDPGATPKNGLIAVQNPAAGQAVALDTVVALTPWISQSPVPDLINQPLAQAENVLTQQGLNYQVAPGIIIPADHPGARSGNIAEQNPVHELPVPLGSTVILTPWVVPVIVPDLKEWPLEQAKSTLAAMGLKYQPGETVPAQGPDREALVGLQSPSAGEAVAPGFTVTLRLYHFQGKP